MAPVSAPANPHISKCFHALSDDTRVQVVEMLSHGERCVCELMDVLDVAQSRLSFHLKTLKDSGLVTDRREGRWMYYALNRDVMNEMVAFLQGVKPGKHAGSCAKACC